jgi:hypothetical protein
MSILNRIDDYLNEAKNFELSNLKIEKNARTKEIMINYNGSIFYIPMGEFDTIKFVSDDGKISTSTSIALANKKFAKYFTKEGIDYLKSEFKKIKSKGLTGENVYMHFHKK